MRAASALRVAADPLGLAQRGVAQPLPLGAAGLQLRVHLLLTGGEGGLAVAGLPVHRGGALDELLLDLVPVRLRLGLRPGDHRGDVGGRGAAHLACLGLGQPQEPLGAHAEAADAALGQRALRLLRSGVRLRVELGLQRGDALGLARLNGHGFPSACDDRGAAPRAARRQYAGRRK